MRIVKKNDVIAMLNELDKTGTLNDIRKVIDPSQSSWIVIQLYILQVQEYLRTLLIAK